MKKLILLKTDLDYKQFRNSRLYINPFLKLRVKSGLASQTLPRFGFIIPKKIVKRVVDRNRIKRRLKGFFILNLEHVIPADLLIFPQAPLLNLKTKRLREELIDLFNKAGIWNK